MCNGDSHNRETQGGTLAVLRPLLSSTPSPSRPALRRELSLRLAENSAHSTTIATIDGLASESGNDESSFFIIHRDGDLRCSGIDSASVLHCLAVPNAAREGVSFALGRRLDLGVGGEGVIGRRVSFVVGRRVVGQGVMGWN